MASEQDAGGAAAATPRRWARGGKQRTRAALLEAAAEVFAERGYDGAPVEEIARAAGVSVGSIYSHFGNKQNLFMALMDQFLAQDLDVAQESLTDGLRGVIPAMNDRLVSTADSRQLALLDAESWLYAVRNPPFHEALAEHDAATRAAAARLVAVERERHDERWALSDDEVATVVHALYRGLIRQRRLQPDSVPDDLYGRVLALLATSMGRTADGGPASG